MNFCIRAPKEYKIVRLVQKLNLNEALIFWRPTSTAAKKCHEMGLDPSPILVRVVRLKLKHDKDVFLITSLLNQKSHPHSEFGDLYHLRWRVEEDYKIFKEHMELGNCTGRTLTSVQQDFPATVFTKNLTSIPVAKPRDEIHRQSLWNKHLSTINFAQALSTMKGRVIDIFASINPTRVILDLFEEFLSHREIVRPGLSNPRYRNGKKPVQLKDHHMAYKRTA